jgi:hypothetical protein
MHPCIQSVRSQNGGKILAILWMDEFGGRVGAYEHEGGYYFYVAILISILI